MRDTWVYCILLDEKDKVFDVKGPVSDDTEFYLSLRDAKNRGFNLLKANVVSFSSYKSIDAVKFDDVPEGYKYMGGLFEKYGVKIY